MPTTTSTPSWPAKRLLLALPLSFLLFSCEEPTDIGLNVQPDSQVGVHFLDVKPIKSNTVLLDSIVTSGTNSLLSHLAGYVEDPVFGKITATAYSELRLRDAGFEVGQVGVIDTVLLKVAYVGAYGNTDVPVKLEIRELTEHIGDTMYAYQTTPYGASTLGTLTFTPSDYKPTSSKRVLLNALLDPAFGQRILNAPLSSHDAFREEIKGIAIVPVITEGSKSIANFAFDRDADSSFVEVKYRSAGERKSLKLYLDRPARRYHSVKADRTGTPTGNLVNNGDTISPQNGETFIQAGFGLRTVYKFPDLENLRQQIGAEIAINKAELLMPAIDSENEEFAPPTALVMAEAAGNRVYQPNGSIRFIGTDAQPNGLQAVRYDTLTNSYHAQLGTYLQSMIYGGQQNRGIVVYSASNAVQINRVRIAAPGPNGTRLRVYYTKVQ